MKAPDFENMSLHQLRCWCKEAHKQANERQDMLDVMTSYCFPTSIVGKHGVLYRYYETPLANLKRILDKLSDLIDCKDT